MGSLLGGVLNAIDVAGPVLYKDHGTRFRSKLGGGFESQRPLQVNNLQS